MSTKTKKKRGLTVRMGGKETYPKQKGLILLPKVKEKKAV